MFIDGAANPKKDISGIGILIIETKQHTQTSENLHSDYDTHEADMVALH